MRILITGAGGFIGSHMQKRLAEEHEVVAWMGPSNNTVSQSEHCRSVDLTHLAELERALSGVCFDAIFHCAGLADVGVSIRNPLLDFEKNVLATRNLIETLMKSESKDARFIFLSSAAVYGNPAALPVSESEPKVPLSPYALHKCMCEDICEYAQRLHGFDVRIARIFSAYGPGLEKQIFWDMFQKVSRFGRLDMRGTGDESRDYVYIDDLVEALVLIAISESDNRVFNIASGTETTIRQVACMFAHAMGLRKSDIAFDGIQMEGSPVNWRADVSRLESLGFKARTSLEDGVQRYVQWAVPMLSRSRA